MPCATNVPRHDGLDLLTAILVSVIQMASCIQLIIFLQQCGAREIVSSEAAAFGLYCKVGGQAAQRQPSLQGSSRAGMDGLPPPAPRRARCPWACLWAGAKLRRPHFCHDWSSLLGSWRSHTLLPCGEAEASLSARMPVRVLGRRGGARARVFRHGALHAHGLALLSSRALCSFARRSSYLMYSPGCLCGLLGSSGPFCCGGPRTSGQLWLFFVYRRSCYLLFC